MDDRKIPVAAILVALVPACSIGSRAATYYISSSEGSDSNNGLSPQSAWKNLDKIYLKYTFLPGDQILLNRGDVWDGQVRISARGTAAMPVLLGSYGTGRNPVIYGDSHTLAWAPVTGYPGLFTASVGFGSTLAGAYQQTTTLTNLPVAGSCGGRGCNLQNPTDLRTYLTAFTPGSWGYSDSTAWVMTLDGMPPTTVTIFRSATISVQSSQYLVIQDLDIRRSNTGIDVAGSSNMTIRSNSLEDLLGIGVYLRGTDGKDVNNVIEHNRLTRTGNDALYVLEGSGNTFRWNTISHVTNQVLGIPTSGDQCGIGLQQSTNTTVEHNSISTTHGTCFDYYYETGSTVRYNYCYQPGTGGATPHGTGLSVYYNIFDLGGHGIGINAVNTGSSPDLIYNNTFYATSGYALMGGDSVSDGGTGAIIFRNNVVQATSLYLMARGDGSNEAGINVSSDYNLFYTTGKQLFSNLGISYSSFTDYQTASGQDAHSIFLEPQFVSAPPTFAERFPLGERAADFRLQSTSPGTRAGQNLQSAGFVGFTDQYVDYAGNPIPSGFWLPNMGAYQ
jgi:hypothetical protein